MLLIMKRERTKSLAGLGVLTCLWTVPVGAQERAAVQVEEATVAYRDIGQGQPLVLLHGFGESGATWDPIASALSQDYRLIIPDLRGHGASSNPLGYFTHRDAASDILGLLDALGLDQVKAVGFSSGAMTLLHIATSEPSRVTAMALVGGTPYLPETARQIMRSMDPDAMPMASLDAMGLVHGDTTQARRLLHQFVGFQDSYTDVNFTPPMLSTITATTLVVHGDRDPFFPVTIPVGLYQAIPDSYLLVFPNLGHEPFPGDPEGLEFYVDTLRRFFNGDLN